VAHEAVRLAERVPRLAGHRVTIVGDPVLDVYLYGSTERISREAPVLIVREENKEHRLGGAANTAANVAAIGGKASLLGFIGADQEGQALAEVARGLSIDTSGLLERSGGVTVAKTRVLAGALHTRRQQMLRIDRENTRPVSEADRALFLERATASLASTDALIISDYGEVSLTASYLELARRARALGKRVIVDSRHALASFVGVSAVTPNETEVEEALGVQLGTPEAASRAAERLVKELDLEAALVTRGREGMVVAERGGPTVLLPAHGKRDALDVTGAGDTVTAIFTLALSAGASVLDAAKLANVGASIVVQKLGAATCSPAELAAELP
jgi:D-glycero-beta-D-manno-heptose-7-phosphate kinase